MNKSTNVIEITRCPARTPWCTQHEHDARQCVSPAIGIEGGHCYVWLVQEPGDAEPTITVDVPTSGADLTLHQASDLSDAIAELRQAAIFGTEVRR